MDVSLNRDMDCRYIGDGAYVQLAENGSTDICVMAPRAEIHWIRLDRSMVLSMIQYALDHRTIAVNDLERWKSS